MDAKRLVAEFVHLQDAAAFAQPVAVSVQQWEPFLGRVFWLPGCYVRWVEFSGQLQATPPW